MRRTAALIVGGGPAGAAAALTLARAGAPHLLFERSRTPQDALCGGFLSWRTLATLDGLGIAADELNPHAVTRVRLFCGQRSAAADLPHPARAVSRRRLDALLLDRAISAGAAVERGVTVRHIAGTTVGVAGDTLTADALFLASGKHEIRGAARPVRRAADPAIGLRVRLPADRVLARLIGDAVELHLFRGGYAGLVLQEDGSANLCAALRRSVLTAAGSPAELLRQLGNAHPALGERLARAAALPPADAVANVPYGWRATSTDDDVFRIGDQAAVIPSLAGEGMGIALASGVAAVRAYRRDGAGAACNFQTGFARRVRRPVGIARALWSVAEHTPVTVICGMHVFPRLAEAAARWTRINR